MTITAPDIKLLESERMADTTDGGGRRTSRVIPDSVAGNIFPKVSRLDSVYGRVNLRKVYGAVQTGDVDTYAGAHAIITDPPDNALIHTTLFTTASEFDTRTTARDRIESYVTNGPESRMTLLGRQLAGQQQVVVYQRVEDALPEVGEVYCLTNEVGSTISNYQYFRAQTVEHETRIFTDGQGDFTRRVIAIGTGIALRYEFNGPENASRLTTITKPSKIRTTTVVDAARYFGIQPLAEAAEEGDLQIKVASVYTPIVPTTNRETPIANANMVGAVNIVASKVATVSEAASATWANSESRYTRRPITPGTLTITGAGVTPTTDDRKGVIGNASFSATVDYESGTITRTGGAASASAYTLTYRPGGVATQIAHTRETEVTIGNRGTVYVYTLNPLPSPGSVFFDYRALGKWYRLRDNGAGEVKGDDPAYGIGSLDYATGVLTLTLGALPDVGSSNILGWGAPLHYAVRADATSNAGTSLKQTITLPDAPLVAGSLSLTYISGGTPYTATDNAAGAIAGNGITGTVDYGGGQVVLEYTTRLPDTATPVAIAYQQLVPVDPDAVVARSKSEPAAASFALGTGVVAGSFVAALPFAGASNAGAVVVIDNGAGLLVAKGGQTLRGDYSGSNQTRDGRIAADQVVGSIDYATGAGTINQPVVIDYKTYRPALMHFSGGAASINPGWEDAEGTMSLGTGAANYGWKDSGVSAVSSARTFDAEFPAFPLVVDLTRSITERYVPGSLMFAAGGKTYIDRNGSLYTDVSNINGAGVLAGTVDYVTGKVSLTHWTNGSTLNLSIIAGLTTYGEYSAYEVFFRTAGAPIRSGSFYVQATTEGGQLLNGTTSEAGVISGTKVAGEAEQEIGVVRVRFGQMVAAAGNESEWWYHPDAVVGGMIFKPELIIPSTLRYNAVVVSNLPLNADILGLDPVRLPADGRVPIYRPADVVVIHNTQDFTLPDPAVASATYVVGRTDLAELWLVDQAGVKVATNQYIVGLAAGTVTMAADLNLTGLAQPLVAKHRVEDLALLSDVQINGQLTLTAPLSRDFAAGSTYVSSALLFGDMNARVENVFDLLSFASWSNAPGSGATAQYNDIDYPIEVLNNGALTERWRINFTSTTAFQVIGENLGAIATGTTSADCAPVNTLTGNPYFIIRASGWGSGWAAGNNLRFNTVGAAAPIWIARTVLPGATLDGDAFSLQMRGDVDAE